MRVREGPSAKTPWAPSAAESLDWEPGTVRAGVPLTVPLLVCFSLSLHPWQMLSALTPDSLPTDPLSPLPHPRTLGLASAGEFETCVARGTRVGVGHPSGSALAEGLVGHVHRGSPPLLLPRPL